MNDKRVKDQRSGYDKNLTLILMMKSLCLLALFILLTACSGFSLAEDITPPPGAEVSIERPTQAPLSGPLYPLVPPNPANGQAIFLEKCAPCHGQTGLGDGPQANQLPNPPAPLGSVEFALQSTPVEWYTTITQGNLERFMPPFNSLTERQRWDVVAYLFTLSVKPETLAQGEELYQANCAGCHGDSGQGNGQEATNLDAQLADFTDQELMAYKSAKGFFQAITNGIPPAMPAFGVQLTDDERLALAVYLRSFSFATATQSILPETTPTTPSALASEATGTLTALVAPISTGTITGQIANLSGGEIPESLAVTLHGFDNMQETLTLSTTLQADGTYTFEGVEMPPGRAFIASVLYNHATYGSDVAVVEEGTTNIVLSIPVYETTTDSTVLSVDRLHIFFEYVEPNTLRVIELFVISNLSDRTVVTSEKGQPVFTIDLPASATNLQFEDGVLGGRYVKTPNGFGDTAAVRPGAGQHQIVLAFDMPYQRRLDIAQPLSLPVNAVVILVPEDGLKVKSDQIQDAGAREVQGLTYHMYSSGRLEVGTTLFLSISGRPGSGTAGLIGGSNTNLVIGLGAFGLALIITGAWLYRRQRTESLVITTSSGGEEADLLAEATPGDPDALMDAILALDDLFQAGELPMEVYQKRRAELKERLKDLLGTTGSREHDQGS